MPELLREKYKITPGIQKDIDNVHKLDKMLSYNKKDGWVLSSNFGGLYIGFWQRKNPVGVKICSSISWDLINIATLISRFDFNAHWFSTNPEMKTLWNLHTALDIQNFYF